MKRNFEIKGIVEKREKKLLLDILVKIFYAMDISYQEFEEIEHYILNQAPKLSEEKKIELKTVLDLYRENKEKIDSLISSHLIGWRFERIGFIERAVLRIGVSYILYLKEKLHPDQFKREIRYIISFLLEIQECFGSDKKSVKFVNGVLSSILRDIYDTTTV